MNQNPPGSSITWTKAENVARSSFRLKKDADAFALTAGTEVREGRHVADSASATIKEAAKLWIAARERAGRERSTIAQYKNHIDLHINPLIGDTRLTALTAPALRQFEDDLLDGGRSAAMVRRFSSALDLCSQTRRIAASWAGMSCMT